MPDYEAVKEAIQQVENEKLPIHEIITNIGPRIRIGEEYDGFTIIINGKHFAFNQEDDKRKLVDVFKELGFENVDYAEWY